MKILVAVEPIDGRKGIDSPAQLCRERRREEQFSGAVFPFRTRSKTSVMALVYDLCGRYVEFRPLTAVIA